jgi:hypothetical protein
MNSAEFSDFAVIFIICAVGLTACTIMIQSLGFFKYKYKYEKNHHARRQCKRCGQKQEFRVLNCYEGIWELPKSEREIHDTKCTCHNDLYIKRSW